jgi:glycosyltransferase involved in cell wall biosynthesis
MVIAAAVPLPPYPAGSAIVCASLLQALAQRGRRIRAIAPATAETWPAAEEFDAQHPELGATRFAVPYFEGYAFTAPDTAGDRYRAVERAGIQEGLRRLLGAERPDVVLVGREIDGGDAADVCRDEALRSLLISHGGPSTAIARGARPPTRAARLLAGLAAADVVVSVARHWATVLRRLGVPRVVAIPNPVDLDGFAPRPRDPPLARALGLWPDDVVALHASNVSTVKRVQDVVEAARIASPRDPRLVFVMRGDGPGRSRAEARWGLQRAFSGAFASPDGLTTP